MTVPHFPESLPHRRIVLGELESDIDEEGRQVIDFEIVAGSAGIGEVQVALDRRERSASLEWVFIRPKFRGSESKYGKQAFAESTKRILKAYRWVESINLSTLDVPATKSAVGIPVPEGWGRHFMVLCRPENLDSYQGELQVLRTTEDPDEVIAASEAGDIIQTVLRKKGTT